VDVADAAATLKAEESAATKDFLGLKWGFGIGAAGDLSSRKRVDSAKAVNGVVRVDETSQVQPRIFLEIHLFGLSQLAKNTSFENMDPKPLFGQGLWVGVQSSSDQVIDAFALGWMWGWRKSSTSSNSLNLGLGLVLDPKVQVLGDGFKENQPLPTGETEIRYKKESHLGAVLVTSFSF
jgi:hypothetical protein